MEASALPVVMLGPEGLSLCQWELSKQVAGQEVAAGYQDETGLDNQSQRYRYQELDLLLVADPKLAKSKV